MKKMMFAAVVAAVSCAFADGEDPYADYVKMTADDNNSFISFSTKGRWNDNLAPHEDANYYVASDRILFMTGVMRTDDAADYTNCWHGGQLVLAGKFRPSVGAGTQFGPCVPDLVLLGGAEIQYPTYGFFANHQNKSTTVTVQSTFDNPATISQHYYDSAFKDGGYRGCVANARFVGNADAHLQLTRPFVNYSGTKIDHGFYFQMNDYCFTDYAGTLTILGSNTIVTATGGAMNAPNCAVRLVDAPDVNFGGNQDGDAWAAAKMRSLSAPSGKLSFYYQSKNKRLAPRLDVTESLTFGSDVTLKVNGAFTRDDLVGMPVGGTFATLARFANLGPGATVSMADDLTFDFAVSPVLPPYCPVPYLKVGEKDGERFIDVAVDKLVTMDVGNIETTGTAGTQYGSFEPGHGSDFSNKEEPTSDKDYHYYMRAKLCCFKSIDMPLATLTYAAGRSWKGGSTIRFKEIGMYTGDSMGMWGSDRNRYVIADKLHVIPNGTKGSSAGYWFNATHDLRLMADFYGPSNAIFKVYTPTAEGFVNLCNDNSNYHGQFIFSQSPASGKTCVPYQLKVYVSDGRNWGGAYTGASAYDAIFLDNFPQVNVTNDTVLAQVNRGLLIRGGAKLNVSENKMMKLANQVTYAGITTKTGAGTLELAGTARFLDGKEMTAPVAETNVLAVAEGALKVSSKAAADGLAISFAAGTKLVIPSDTEAGLYDVKWDAPITVEGGAKLPVEIEIAAADADKSTLAVPICTVNETAGESLTPESFKVARTSNHMKCVSVTKSVANGEAVFTANFERQGVVIILR